MNAQNGMRDTTFVVVGYGATDLEGPVCRKAAKLAPQNAGSETLARGRSVVATGAWILGFLDG